MGKEESKKKISALSVGFFIVFLLILAGVVWRLNIVNFFIPKAEPLQEEYLVSFRISNIRSTSEDYLQSDEIFYLSDGTEFGILTGNISVTPAEKYVENSDGTCALVYDAGEGDQARIDVCGTFLVHASKDDTKDLLLLNGSSYIAPNCSFTIHSSFYEVTLLVTDVVKK